MLRMATLVALCATTLAAEGLPKQRTPKPSGGRLERIGKVLTSNTRKAKAVRFALGFAATGTVLALRPGSGAAAFPAGRAAAAPVIITPGRTQFGCGGCVGPDWTAGRP